MAAWSLRERGVFSAGLILFGLAYWVLPNDLIPDDTRYGLVDDAIMLVACFVGAFTVSPIDLRRRMSSDAKFRLRVLRADLGNFGLIEHRYVDGFLISGKNSGSHWVKYMLSVGLARKHGLAPPRFCSGREADRIVGRASRDRRGRGYPQIATSHTIPSVLLAALPWPRWVRQPPIVLMVRDIPEAMRSNYRKWQERYSVPIADFAQGDPRGRRFIADAWWYAHFFNRWGLLAKRQNARVLVVHYEDMLADPAPWLRKIATHLQLDLPDAALEEALASGTKDRMRDLQDPDAGETIVPERGEPPAFSAADARAIEAILRRYQKFDFGYRRAGRYASAGSGA